MGFFHRKKVGPSSKHYVYSEKHYWLCGMITFSADVEDRHPDREDDACFVKYKTHVRLRVFGVRLMSSSFRSASIYEFYNCLFDN